MKKRFFFAEHCVWLLLVFPLAALCQDPDPSPNYVVIGAFANRDNAVSFTDDAKRHKFPAQFEMNFNRNLYYVYVLTTIDRDQAVAEAVRIRAETKYFDTWVYSGGFSVLPLTRSEDAPQGDIDPVTGAIMQPIASAAVPAPPPSRASKEPLQPADVAGKNFYFHLYRSDNGNTVAGEVDAIDFARSVKMATYPANESVSVQLPAGESKHISFICQVFGYRKQQIEYDPLAPAESFYLDDKGNVVVPFELVRLQKGDIAIMYNVFFFKDAAVMRPESRYEVNNLLELLRENPSYSIRIHGHTNGNANGRIIRMDTPGNFYSLTGTRQGFGSAKKLSEERAEVIKDFLVHSGIAADRMTVKAWGGKKPLHDPRSVRAIENVRVEIEILAD